MLATRVVRAVVGLSLLAGFTAGAATLPQRIAAVNDASRVSLRDGVSPRAKAATDLGITAGEKTLTTMSLRFSLTDAQQSALTQLLIDQQNPASARYHQWLTPEQFGAQFGLAATDLAKVTSWLTSQGFTVTKVARGGTYVSFTGTVAQANKAFQTEIHNLQLADETHLANLKAPTLPAAIAAVTLSVKGLDDFTMKPHHVKRIIPSANGAKPEFTSQLSGNHYLAPGDLYTIYDIKSLISSSINGTGVTIAVVGQSDINLSDAAAFRTASGLAANPPTVQLYGSDPGKPTQSDFDEASLDVQWSGAIAPNASILFVNSTNVIDGSLTEAIDNNLAPIISDSYGDCESNVGTSSLAVYNTLLQQAASQGITITAASGDSGATDCDYNTSTAQGGLTVDFPGSSPYVTSVGGTEFNEGTGTYFSATNGTNSGSALQYIPEVVWNDSLLGGGLAAGGGGASLYYAKPSWQTGNGVPADFSRDVPDVALDASADHDGYLICEPGYCASGAYAAPGGALDVVGGTSIASPQFAGLLALVVQKTGGRIGVANNKIYALANSTFSATVFHDITSGSNVSPCQTGSTNCPSGGSIGYTAAVGYDLASGWGSVDAANMVNDWALVTALPTTGGVTTSVTNLTASANSVSAGTAVTMTATVASGSSSSTTTPTGSVQFTIDGVASGSAVALSGGVATYALPTTGLSSGVHLIQATYLGDATYSGSKGAFSLNVTSATGADFSLTPHTTTVTVTSGSHTPSTTTFTVLGLNGFTGSVAFSASASSSLNATYSFTINPVTLASGSGTTTLNLFAYTGGLAKNGTLQAATRKQDLQRTGTGIVLAGLLLLFVPRRRKLGALLMLLVGFGALSTVGCLSSAAVNATSSQVNTNPGTYQVTVSATGTISGTAVTHSSTVTFVVQ